MKTQIITLDCTIDENVDPMIIREMVDRLNPPKPFSYVNGDHEQGDKLEKEMRERAFNKFNEGMK